VEPNDVGTQNAARQTKEPCQANGWARSVVVGRVEALQSNMQKLASSVVLVLGIQFLFTLAGTFVELLACIKDFVLVIVVSVVVIVVVVIVVPVVVVVFLGSLATDAVTSNQVVGGQRIAIVLLISSLGSKARAPGIGEGIDVHSLVSVTPCTNIVDLVVGVGIVVLIVVVVVVVISSQLAALHEFTIVYVIALFVVAVRQTRIAHALVIAVVVSVIVVLVVVVVAVLVVVVVAVLIVVSVWVLVQAIGTLVFAGRLLGFTGVLIQSLLGFSVGFHKVPTKKRR
jgi:hypothetical protein